MIKEKVLVRQALCNLYSAEADRKNEHCKVYFQLSALLASLRVFRFGPGTLRGGGGECGVFP